jgi:hypothetical protein
MKFDHSVELIGENMAPGAVDANLGISEGGTDFEGPFTKAA